MINGLETVMQETMLISIEKMVALEEQGYFDELDNYIETISEADLKEMLGTLTYLNVAIYNKLAKSAKMVCGVDQTGLPCPEQV